MQPNPCFAVRLTVADHQMSASATRRTALRSNWRVSVAIDEGLKNWRHGRWLTALVTVFTVVALSATAIADGIGIARLVEGERVWVSAGGRMLVATNEDAGGIPRAACESAARIDGVAASAALDRLPARSGLANAPHADLPVVAAGAGLSALLGVDQAVAGAILPSAIADSIGVSAGESIIFAKGSRPLTEQATLLPTGPVTVAAVTDTTVLGEDFAYSILLPTPAHGLAGSCHVRVEPGQLDTARSALPALLSTSGQDAVVADRLIGGEYTRDFSDEYASRGLQHAPWLAGAAITLLWLLLVWIRRSRDGLYATLGADRATRTIIRATEGLALLSTSAVAAAFIIPTGLALTTSDLAAVIPDAARHLVIAVSVAVVGVSIGTLVPLRSPLAALKDR